MLILKAVLTLIAVTMTYFVHGMHAIRGIPRGSLRWEGVTWGRRSRTGSHHAVGRSRRGARAGTQHGPRGRSRTWWGTWPGSPSHRGVRSGHFSADTAFQGGRERLEVRPLTPLLKGWHLSFRGSRVPFTGRHSHYNEQRHPLKKPCHSRSSSSYSNM